MIISLPTLYYYSKGVTKFYSSDFKEAVQLFEKILKHKVFQKASIFAEFFAYYGQSLCAVGELDKGAKYLIIACQEYEQNNWDFEEARALNLAKSTLSALKHIKKHTDITIDANYLVSEPKLKKTV